MIKGVEKWFKRILKVCPVPRHISLTASNAPLTRSCFTEPIANSAGREKSLKLHTAKVFFPFRSAQSNATSISPALALAAHNPSLKAKSKLHSIPSISLYSISGTHLPFPREQKKEVFYGLYIGFLSHAQALPTTSLQPTYIRSFLTEPVLFRLYMGRALGNARQKNLVRCTTGLHLPVAYAF